MMRWQYKEADCELICHCGTPHSCPWNRTV